MYFFSAQAINRPKLCTTSAWNSTATTFADGFVIGADPLGFFITTDNTMYAANYEEGRIIMWPNGNQSTPRNISDNLAQPQSIFVTNSGDIYVDTNNTVGQVLKLAVNTSNYVPVLSMCSQCFDMAVDVLNNLYCVMQKDHKVVSVSLTTRSNLWKTVAGTGIAGNNATALNAPRGMIVDTNLDLYVTDCKNNRVQKFRFGERNAVTIVGNGAPGTTSLNCPAGLAMNADGYLFITDNGNHRVIGQNSNGFRCVASCNGGASGSGATQLLYPNTMRFDSFGNIFIVDRQNDRIQTFVLLTNGCGKYCDSTQTQKSMFLFLHLQIPRQQQHPLQSVFILTD